MCGIFGVIGDENSYKQVFSGLKDIEYRGYDSWGISFFKDGKFQTHKEIGFLPKNPPYYSTSKLALGHTRWATHGGVTKQNAHPHSDCHNKLILVHNGIVENYLDLKKQLKGHAIKSETDSEIIIHLIEDQLKKTPDLTKSVSKIFKNLHGLNAIVVSDGQQIIAAKMGSPLVLGKTKSGFIVASDPNAILPFTKKLLFLEDDQLVVLGQNLQLYQASSLKPLQPHFITVKWQHSKADLKQFKHFLEKEITEQPKVLQTIANNSEEIEKIANLIKNAYGTFFIACGSAANSCLLGTYLFSKFAKTHVNFSIGSEFNYIQDYLTKKSLLIAVSQSGETIDVVEPVQQAKKRGVKVASLVNVLGSTLYRLADHPLLLQAGVEKAVCSTKALTAMFASMVMLSLFLANRKSEARKIVLDSAKEITRILKNKDKIKALAQKIHKSEHIFILGRGLSYPVALESTLKIKENTYIHAEGFAGGELKHGVIALISKGTPVIVFVPNDETKDAILANAMEVKARGAFIVGVGPENNPVFDYYFQIKDVGASSVIPNPVFAQILSYYLALKLGKNPDKPRNLAKSVVVR